MKYDVNWISVEQSLAALWVEAPNQQEVTDAANLMDRLLSIDAHLVGESREGNARILIVPPLAIYFDVIQDDQRVVIWRIWRSQA